MDTTDGPRRVASSLGAAEAPYALERELGRGGMATVYLAHDRKHDRAVAVKVLHADLAAVVGAERFLQEIRVTAHLQHPHIPGLIDSGVFGPEADHLGELDAVVPVWRMLHDAFAFQLEVEALLVRGDTVVARFVQRGTSVGPFRGQAPTGASSAVLAIEWFELQGGRIRRRWGVRDSAAHFRQMGLTVG